MLKMSENIELSEEKDFGFGVSLQKDFIFQFNIFTSTWFSSAQNSFYFCYKIRRAQRILANPKCRKPRFYWREKVECFIGEMFNISISYIYTLIYTHIYICIHTHIYVCVYLYTFIIIYSFIYLYVLLDTCSMGNANVNLEKVDTKY